MTKLVSKIIAINKRRTSMRMCLKEWSALKEICLRENINCNKLVELVENTKNPRLGLTYATRLFVLLYFQQMTNRYTPAQKGTNDSRNTSSNVLNILKNIK